MTKQMILGRIHTPQKYEQVRAVRLEDPLAVRSVRRITMLRTLTLPHIDRQNQSQAKKDSQSTGADNTYDRASTGVLLDVEPVLVSPVSTFWFPVRNTFRAFCQNSSCGAMRLAPPLPITLTTVVILRCIRSGAASALGS